MNIKLTTVSLLLALSTFASARLGETEEQCVERYGEVESIGKSGSRYFSKNGIFLSVRFDEDGKASYLCYSNVNESDLTEEHAQILVEANGDGWVKERRHAKLVIWKKSGYAAFLNKTGYVFVMTELELDLIVTRLDKRNKELRAF